MNADEQEAEEETETESCSLAETLAEADAGLANALEDYETNVAEGIEASGLFSSE